MREDPRTKKALARLVRHPSITLKALAADLGTSYDAVHSWTQAEGPVPTLAQVRALVWAAARQDPEAARELAADLFGLGDAGWVLSSTPRPSPGAADLVAEVLQAGAAVGEVTGWAAEAAPGGISAGEADEGWRRIRKAQRELAEAAAVVERLRAPQLAWQIAGVTA